MKGESTTPMLKQYFEIKDKYKDSILFFRLGDFYEMFSEDAITASEVLDIVLTKRNKGTQNEVPMCGVPHHSADSYISKLTNAGYKVAICEQITEPSSSGIVERDVVRIITPGTSISDNVLSKNKNNFLCAINFDKNIYSLGFVDLSTGDFFITSTDSVYLLIDEIYRLRPSEIITKSIDSELINKLKLDDFRKFNFDLKINYESLIKEQYNIKSLDPLGIQNNKNLINITGYLIAYLLENQKNSIPHIKKPKILNLDEYMHIDDATLRNLQILEDRDNYSLLNCIDKTVTAMGGRMLNDIITKPLLDKNKLEYRYSLIKYFTENKLILTKIREVLKRIKDVERILGKIGCNTCKPIEIITLGESLKAIEEIKKYLIESKSDILNGVLKKITDQSIVIELIDESILEEPALEPNKGRVIKESYNKDLNELFQMVDNSTKILLDYQQNQRKITSIPNLKIKYNKVFGYFIEISKGKTNMAPSNYQRRQTLVNAERYTTDELKDMEIKILSAKEESVKLEEKILNQIIEKIKDNIINIQNNASEISFLDLITSFSALAVERNYSCPNIENNKNCLIIEEGRHPVIETSLSIESFIPNNTYLSEKNSIKLLTWPNMAGKSTYLRQVALIALLAQIGSFVPAKKMTFSLIDGIYTRVGASDNLARGQSTFMVEMQESAYILNNATEKSLVILDEIGRGTSTYDGLSIAWSILEYIHESIKSKTLFATHYHELIEVTELLPEASNLSVDAHEENGEIYFLYNIVERGVDQSYGIEVAKIAGLPKIIIDRAKEILHSLEISHSSKSTPMGKGINQQSLFENINRKEYDDKVNAKIIDDIQKIDINNITPIEALGELQQIQKQIENDKKSKEKN